MCYQQYLIILLLFSFSLGREYIPSALLKRLKCFYVYTFNKKKTLYIKKKKKIKLNIFKRLSKIKIIKI